MIRNLTDFEQNVLLDATLKLESRLSEQEKVDYGYSRERFQMERVPNTPDGFYYRNSLPQRTLERGGFVEEEFPMFKRDREWGQKMNEIFGNTEISEEERGAQMDKLRESSPFNDPNHRGDFGVADTVEQVVEYYSILADDARNFIVDVAFLQKSDEPKEGGWRWHKWGEYIGTKEPQAEYLAHEPEIEEVVLFRLTELKTPEAGKKAFYATSGV